MTSKTHRLEARIDAELDALIGAAADARQVSKSAFVSDAVREAALRTLARADVTWMDVETFEALLGSLDTADESPELESLARRPRLIEW
jgi:uncharacterized protein (DUF1778 family)